MGWRENYRQASFRGAAFFVANADSAYGRRVATHEHAQRDVPFNEDMGRKARGFTVDGYLLGKDYNTARDALIKACEEPGAATLVHPYRGDLTVNCTDLRVSESSAELSYCRIAMTFIEAGSNSFPRTKIDTVNAISKKAVILQDKGLTGFTEKFLTEGFPGYVLESAAGMVTKIADYLGSPGTTLQGSISAISKYYAKVNALRATATGLVRRPLDLAKSIQNIMRDMQAAFGINAGTALKNTYKEFSKPYVGPASPTVPPGTPAPPITASRAQEKANYIALQDLTRLTAIGETSIVAAIKATSPPPSMTGSSSSSGGSSSDTGGGSSSGGGSGGSGTGSSSGGSSSSTGEGIPVQGFESLEEAREERNELEAAISVEEEHTDSDPVFTALGALSAEIVKGIPQPDNQLPDVVHYAPKTTQPALKVAQILYDDADRADEIAIRNKVRHPGFLVGRQPLEVLSDG